MKRMTEITGRHYEPLNDGRVKCVIFTAIERGEGYGVDEKRAFKDAKRHMARYTPESVGSE